MAETSRRQKRKKRKQRRNIVKKISYILVLTILATALFLLFNENYFHFDGIPTISQIMQYVGLIKRPKVVVDQDEIAVHYLDVGQGDCVLIKTPDKNVLIDCGEESESDYVISYLKDFDVERLDYVIITHPHSDHMGGMAHILSAFDIGEVMMPKVSDDLIPISYFYEDTLDIIEEKGIAAFFTMQGQKFELCEGTSLEILGPVSDDFDNLNDFSVVAKLVSGNYSFLFTGDMENAAEKDLMDYWINVSADILKVAHHGSSTSTSYAFLKRIAPTYAVISVGEDNSYGHPTSEILDRLEAMDCKILMTKDEGDIVFITDGNDISYVTTNNQTEVTQ